MAETLTTDDILSFEEIYTDNPLADSDDDDIHVYYNLSSGAIVAQTSSERQSDITGRFASNWEDAINTALNLNSASLLSTGISTSWLALVIASATNSITNSLLAQMAANTIKGVTTAGDPTDLTATEVTAMLDAATSSLQGMMSAADKATLDLYPDTLGTNWDTALAAALGTNWTTALAATLATNSASLLSTGINADWLAVVTAAIANSITNSMLAQMAANTLKGVTTAGDPTDLTATEVTAMLDAATSSLQGMMSAADKAKLDLYPDTLGTNWDTALAAALGTNWTTALAAAITDDMVTALANVTGFGSNLYTASDNDVYDTLTYTGSSALFNTSATNTPDSSVGWLIWATFVSSATKEFMAYSTSMGIRFGHATEDTITWENVYSSLSVGDNWDTALSATLGSNWTTAFSYALGNYTPARQITNNHVDATIPVILLYKAPYEGTGIAFKQIKGTIILRRGTASSELDNLAIDLNCATAAAVNNCNYVQSGGKISNLYSWFGIGICTYDSERWLCLYGNTTTSTISSAYFSGWCSDSEGPILETVGNISDYTADDYITKQYRYHNNGLIIDENVLATGQSTLLQNDVYYVINSDTTFQTLCDATSGTYPKVKVLAGSWTSTSTLTLDTTGIKEIIGENGAILNFSLSSLNYGIVGTGDEIIDNVEITYDTDVTTGNYIVSTIKKIINCTIDIDNTNGLIYGIYNTDYVEDNILNISAGSSSYNIRLIYSCTNVVNNTFNATSEILAPTEELVYHSENVSNIYVNFSAGFQTLYITEACHAVSNIYSNLTSTSTSILYIGSACYEMNNIHCIFTGSGNLSYAFNGCRILSNIYIDETSTSTGDSIIFMSCYNVDNVFLDLEVDNATLKIMQSTYHASNIHVTISADASTTWYAAYSCYNVNNINIDSTYGCFKGFYNTKNISNVLNSSITATGTVAVTIFDSCDNISKVRLVIGCAQAITGVTGCDIVSDIYLDIDGVGSSTYPTIGITGCTKVHNSVLTISASSSGSNTGISSCTDVSYNDVTMPDDANDAFVSCTGCSHNSALVGVFDSCYADRASSVAVANTAAGGYNYTA